MQTDTASLKVFLADDSLAIRQRVGDILASHAMTVVGEAETPQACIAAILRLQPDVVVLDCQLEGGTGLDVLKAIRSADPAIAVVVFSNNSGPGYRKRYLAEGATRFLDKTTEFDQLATAVAQASASTH